jgi:hypothetical protein
MARSRKERKRFEEKRANSIPKTKNSSTPRVDATMQVPTFSSLNGVITGTSFSFGSDPLSKEESNELTTLVERYNLDKKLLKIETFKKLPFLVRQNAINLLIWQQYKRDISKLEPEKTARHIELEQRKNSGLIPISGSIWGSGYSLTIDLLPEGITQEDLEKAHVDASLEEQVLNGQD